MKQKIHTYTGDDVTVTYDVNRCIHARECVRGLREVFDPDKRPWIQPDNAKAGDVMDVIERCPTGALHYVDTKQNRQEAPSSENQINIVPDGPLYVRGDVELQDEEGNVLLQDTRVALCRCGQSENKPLCDGNHNQVRFNAPADFSVPSVETSNETGFTQDPRLVLKAQKNGPMLVRGSFRLQSPVGQSQELTGSNALCRCGGSGNKPFCDGTHKKIGFES